MSRLQLTRDNLPSTNKIVEILALVAFILALVFAVRFVWQNPLSNDSWSHMAIGHYIVDNKQIPHHNDISYKLTDPSLEWISHSWLSDVLIYFAGSIGPVFAAFFPGLSLQRSEPPGGSDAYPVRGLSDGHDLGNDPGLNPPGVVRQ